ncbi:uncharacterized protein LOC126750275 [Anthonomus grandis grandis]|uniref:uncharacterized protein LOC126750275 n=1 Tax=Anthonomus grandis grandis TaxID=2921223 RepID=UPI00216590CF|nr:uncharacterized protein LOC126750275 [Anthonomus grandis grandis]
MNYEREQIYLGQLFDEVATDEEPLDDDSSLQDDDEETQDHNTDDEQDIDDLNNILDLPDEIMEEVAHEKAAYYIGKDGQTKWRKHPGNSQVRTSALNIIKFLPGVKGNAKGLKFAAEIWSLFFTNEMLQVIVDNTNIYIGMCNLHPNKRSARPTDIELKALIGLLYIICSMPKNSRVNASDLFRTNGTSMEIFRLTMSRERFRFLLQYIRFDNKNTRIERQKYDKLAPIREIFDSFNSNLSKCFCVSELTTMDEMLVAFRGRCRFRAYMSNKPNRYGIKIYSLVDAKLFYTANMEIYVGQQPIGPYKVQTDNVSLLSRLCHPISGSSRNITMDNFFTSIAVANANVDKATIVSYIPNKNKNVLMLSTMHRNEDKIEQETGNYK